MTDEKQDAAGIQIKRVRSSGRQTFYVNNAQVVTNQWDTQIYFSLIQEVTPGEYAAVEDLLVIMTPEHALALSKVLKRNLDIFVKKQGAIREIEPGEPTPLK